MICIVKDCMEFTHRGFRKCLECLKGNTPDKGGIKMKKNKEEKKEEKTKDNFRERRR